MKRKITCCVVAAVVCLLLIPDAKTTSAHANSAQTWFSGVDATGAIMPDTESPIIVEKERLTFDIQQFPSNYYVTKEAFLAYEAKVTAEYTFYNPSAYDVTAKLLFPFGNKAVYANEYYDEEQLAYLPFDDTDKFDITVNGEVIEKKIRHTLSSRYEPFVLEQDLALVSDGFATHPFYRTDLTVTKYTFQVNGVDTDRYPAADVAFDVPNGLGDKRLWLPSSNGGHTQGDGEMRVSCSAKVVPYEPNTACKFDLYVFGTPFSTMPVWKAYQNGGVRDGEEIAGGVELLATESTTFQAFALANRKENSAVTETDWYNALVAELSESEKQWDYPIVNAYRFSKGFEGYLMRWYAYTITVGAGERKVNAVTAPLYPSIDARYSPSVFSYTYLLSPAKTWKSFGELEIIVNTPYYLTDNTIEGFAKTNKGYAVTLNGLPEGELVFSLSTAENPKRNKTPYTTYTHMAAVFACAAVLLGIIGGAWIASRINEK